MSYIYKFYSRTARPWDSVSSKCFPLTCYLNGFKLKVNKDLFIFDFFLNSFPVFSKKLFVLFSFSCNYMLYRVLTKVRNKLKRPKTI